MRRTFLLAEHPIMWADHCVAYDGKGSAIQQEHGQHVTAHPSHLEKALDMMGVSTTIYQQ